MTGLRRRGSRSSLATALAISLAVSLALLGLRAAGLFEASELGAYDWYLRLRPIARRPDPRILVVTASERDIQRLGRWPLPDGILADALRILLRNEPRAIGLDIYRDVAVPPGTDKLRRVLIDNPRIIVVTKFGDDPSGGVRAPAVVSDPERVGFNDIVVDPGGIVRRGLLFLDDGTHVFSSFAFRLALLALQTDGVTARPDPDDARLLRLGASTIRPLEANDGAYVSADTRGYQFLLDFGEGDAAFASVDLSSVLAGQLEAPQVRDKVVLIGVTAESIKDYFYTPYSRGRRTGQEVPGVVIHAHVVSQLLRTGLEGAAPMRTLPEWQEVGCLVVWGVIGGLLGLRVRSPWWFSIVAAGGAIGLGVVDLLLFVEGWWIPVVPPAASWVGSAAIVTAYVSYRETLQRADLMRLFSRHVSKEVAETIWRHRSDFLDGGRPRSQRLVVTALFTDLVGFTPVAEKLSPESLMEWLNEYMDAMAHRVSEYGGVIRQYAGDSIVVVFGVPAARRTDSEIAQDAINAVDCALAMAQTLGDLNQRWQAEGRPAAGMRIGIFTGPALAGTLGSAERSEYVVVGDTMNTAARLETFDKETFVPQTDGTPCRILIGQSTLAYLGDRFEVKPIGEFSLKGKERTVAVYRILGRAIAPAISADVPEAAVKEARP